MRAMRVRPPRRLGDESAQGVIEFALIATILMLLFLGTVDYGRFLYYESLVKSSARVGDEAAINHCARAGTGLCGEGAPPATDDEILHAATCEVRSDVQLYPSPTGSSPCAPCAPGACTFTTTQSNACQGTSQTTAAASASQCCEEDICIAPGPVSNRVSGTQTTVYVGYNFRPISFLMSPFFNTAHCFPSGERTHESTHTICASFTGRVY